MIVCLLLPYFAARVAYRERAVAQDVPLLLYAGEHIAAICERAAAQGVTVGMSVRQARWLCPDAQVIPLNIPALRQQTEVVLHTLSQFTHLIETDRIAAKMKPRSVLFPDARQSAVFYVDLERLARDATVQLAQQMGVAVRQETTFEAVVGVATAKFPAYAVASQTRPGHVRVIAAGEEATFLDGLPITLLPMKEETRRRLRLLGLNTLGAFARLPLAAAAAQCGKDGVLLHQMTRGLDPRHLVPVRLQVVERVTRTLELPLSDAQMVQAIVRALAAELSACLQSGGYMGRTLHLQLLLEGSDTVQQKTMLRQAVSSTRYLADALLRLLARLSVTTGVWIGGHAGRSHPILRSAA